MLGFIISIMVNMLTVMNATRLGSSTPHLLAVCVQFCRSAPTSSATSLPKVRLFDPFMEFFLRRSPKVANQLPILWPLLVKELNVLLLCRTLISMVSVSFPSSGNTNSTELIINHFLNFVSHISSITFVLVPEIHSANLKVCYTSLR